MKSAQIYQTLREVFVLLEFANHIALQPYQLDNTEYNALLLLEQETGLRMVDLRERLLCDKSKVTRIVDHLEGRNLAQREPDPADGRAWQVFLTEDGFQLRERAQAAFQEAIQQRFATITSVEQDQFYNLLVSLRTQLLIERNQGK